MSWAKWSATACLFVLLIPRVGKVQPIMPAPTVRADRGGDSNVELIATEQLAARLTVDTLSIRITGRISLDLARSTADRDSGRVQLRGLNVVFFSVPQSALAGGLRVTHPLGTLGVVLAAERTRMLRYVEGDSVLEGTFNLLADTPFLTSLARGSPHDSLSDSRRSPRFPMTGTVRVRLRDVIPARADGVQRHRAEIALDLDAPSFASGAHRFPAFHIETFQPVSLVFDAIWDFCFERVQKLCIQPVRLLRFRWIQQPWGIPVLSVEMTGDGLDFGMPGARKQWRKCGVIFEVREWMTLLAGDFWVLTETEELELINVLNPPDCIEVFFVYDFEPPTRMGCGETWGNGDVNAVVVSSEANSRGEIDYTHLAHELGHVMDIDHPNDTSADSRPGSSGTLMCISGCLADNPKVNSWENRALISNGLLTYAFAPKGGTPDCMDSSDCGPCK